MYINIKKKKNNIANECIYLLYYMYYIIICYIIKLLLHYIYLYINYSNNLFNVPNLFLGRLDVLFTNFMMETIKRSIGYTAVIVLLVIFNPFGI